jgi:DNA-binding PadR family transcriptional regulator
MSRDDRFFFALKHNLRASGPFGPGPHLGGGRGRRRRGVVRIALLMLLAEEPRNGYQLMQAIEERSGGSWRPSPGAVYPALALLEDEGLIRPVERDGVKLLELTDAGREHVHERHADRPPWETSDEHENVGDLRSQVQQLHIAAIQVAQAGSGDQVATAARAVAEARRAMYRILAEETDE